MAVVTLIEAKQQLGIRDSDHDALVQAVLTDADAVLRKWLDTDDDPTWDELTAPAPIKRMVLLLLTHFYEDRGDLMTNHDKVWAAIKHLLSMWRTPTVA